MASTSFMSENQSFSDANTSWASLIVDQVQNSIEDEDYSNILDFDSNPADRSTPVKQPGGSKQQVDLRTFQQVLQVMIQQGAALDRLKEELNQLRQESNEELQQRDARFRLAEKELHSLREEKEKVSSELQELQEELGALKASYEEESGPSDVLSMEDHNRIVLRIKEDSRVQRENLEAEKSHLAIQLTRLQIQVAQLKNQVEDRSYPEEVVEELTKTLRDTVIETCKNADLEAQRNKLELSSLQSRLTTLEENLVQEANEHSKAEDALVEARENLEQLHADYDAVQEQLAISQSMQNQQDEAAMKEAQGQLEHLQAQLSDVERSRDVALMDSEQLRTLLKEAEDRRASLATELQITTNAFTQAGNRVSELEKERDAALAEVQQLRSISHEPLEREATLTSEIEKLKQGLKDTEEQRERAERIAKEAENEFRATKERNDELSKLLAQEQESSKASTFRCSELESELQILKTAHADELVAKASIAEEASSRAEELKVKLDEETRRWSALNGELSEALKHLSETADSTTAELNQSRASLQETEKARCQTEERLKKISESLQSLTKERSELETQLQAVQAAFETASKRRSEVEGELQQAIKNKEAELKDATQSLQTQIDSLTTSLADARAEAAKESELRKAADDKAEEGKSKQLEEIKKLEDELREARQRISDVETERKTDQGAAKGREKQVKELEKTLQQMKKERADALREAERLRLQHAEAVSNQAEADIRNEELQQKMSKLEEEVKRATSLESELKNKQTQLAEAIETMNQVKDQVAKYQAEETQHKTEIAELRSENEQLIAARRQMAAIYGLPAEPLSSPRNTPVRATPSTPLRSSQSLSPSASSFVPQWPEPPAKRRKVSKLLTAGNTSGGGAVIGASPASAIALDDAEDQLAAPPSTPTRREKSAANGDIPKHLIDIYSAFAKLTSWNNDEDRPVCGFCALHNHYNEKNRRSPLNFDPSQYPITFWNHCLMRHKDALRPDIDAWLKTEGMKISGSESFPSGELPILLAKFVSWRKMESTYMCGLCEVEKRRENRDTLNFDPCAEPFLFWTHCHTEHEQFWKPVK